MIPKIIHQVWIGDQSQRPNEWRNVDDRGTHTTNESESR